MPREEVRRTTVTYAAKKVLCLLCVLVQKFLPWDIFIYGITRAPSTPLLCLKYRITYVPFDRPASTQLQNSKPCMLFANYANVHYACMGLYELPRQRCILTIDDHVNKSPSMVYWYTCSISCTTNITRQTPPCVYSLVGCHFDCLVALICSYR